jgi:hypothetical protein
MEAAQREELLGKLKLRFEKNMKRHENVEWLEVLARLRSFPEKLRSLAAMEVSGGEPDVVGHDEEAGELMFMDCSAESPAGRRSVCYDREGLESRKQNKPAHCATEMAAAMGVDLLTEEQYRKSSTGSYRNRGPSTPGRRVG